MRTLVAVVATSLTTALAVHVVDAKAAADAVEATRFVVRDDAGNVRVSIDEHGLVVTDGNQKTRAAIHVGDAPAEPARIWVAQAGDAAGTYPSLFAGGVEMADGNLGIAEPKITIWRDPGFIGSIERGTTRAGAEIVPGEVRLTGSPAGNAAGSYVETATLSADAPSITLRGPNGRVRFRK